MAVLFKGNVALVRRCQRMNNQYGREQKEILGITMFAKFSESLRVIILAEDSRNLYMLGGCPS